MYVVREIVQCKPGKVRQMLGKFKVISTTMRGEGLEPFRLLTDVTGEPFWTLVAEVTVERLDDFFAMEEKLMTYEDDSTGDDRLSRSRRGRTAGNLSNRELKAFGVIPVEVARLD